MKEENKYRTSPVPMDYEQISLRPGRSYVVYREEPSFLPNWWAVRLVPVEFPPGEIVPQTPDGAPVEQYCVIAAEKQKTTGKWLWSHLSPCAKRLFGDLIMNNDLEKDCWWYVAEITGEEST